jgi:DNA-binding transcriptional MocR family regulator
VETEQVAFSPGGVFASREGGHARHCLRLSFADNPPLRLEEGIRRLGRVVKAATRGHTKR